MKTNTPIIVAIVALVLILGYVFYQKNKTDVGEEPTAQASIRGCYVARIARDVYTLKVQTQENSAVTGTIQYQNFEKDSSFGQFTGTYVNDILLANYVFNSEGVSSERQVIFKKNLNSFIEGFGPVAVNGNKTTFVDTSNITFDSNLTYNFTACTDLMEDELIFDVENLEDK